METASSRRPGRPRSFDRAATLHQAMLAFWRHGYETTSVAVLTEVMGITAPSLYTAFGDKRQLFLEAVRLYAQDPEALQAQLDSAPTALQASCDLLTGAALRFTDPALPPGCLLASATASGSTASDDVRAAVTAIRRDVMDRLTARIARDPLPPGTRPDALAAMVMALIQGMSVLARDGVPRETLLAMIEAALRAWPASGDGPAHAGDAVNTPDGGSRPTEA